MGRPLNLLLLSLLLLMAWLFIASEKLSSNDNKIAVYDPSKPASNHKENYNQEFTILESDYIPALALFEQFLKEKNYSNGQFTGCSMKKRKKPCSPRFAYDGKRYLARFIIMEHENKECNEAKLEYRKIKVILTSSKSDKRAKFFMNHYNEKYAEFQQAYDDERENWSAEFCQ